MYRLPGYRRGPTPRQTLLPSAAGRRIPPSTRLRRSSARTVQSVEYAQKTKNGVTAANPPCFFYGLRKPLTPERVLLHSGQPRLGDVLGADRQEARPARRDRGQAPRRSVQTARSLAQDQKPRLLAEGGQRRLVQRAAAVGAMKPYTGPPAMLGSSAAAQVRLVVWCRHGDECPNDPGALKFDLRYA
jgi:hypothetical protein